MGLLHRTITTGTSDQEELQRLEPVAEADAEQIRVLMTAHQAVARLALDDRPVEPDPGQAVAIETLLRDLGSPEGAACWEAYLDRRWGMLHELVAEHRLMTLARRDAAMLALMQAYG